MLQNATDAITARQQSEPGFKGQVSIHITEGDRPTLTFEDNGIGLTENEIQLFLSNIGASTKRDSDDFIGQFGIGLLSCFMVTDEIIMITRSVNGDSAFEWRGSEDGTFVTRRLNKKMSPGTKVYIVPKKEMSHLFSEETLTELIREYGDLLPYPILFTKGNNSAKQVNSGIAPFEERFEDEQEQHDALMAFGKEQLNQSFIDAIPLRTANNKTVGVAYVLEKTPSMANKPNNKVYLKRMMVSDENQDILPKWAFFVQAIINTNELQPTASRESFYQNKTLEKVRKQMGRCIRNYLVQLHQSDPDRLERIISSHRMSMKMLAKDDEEFFRIVIHYMRFPSTIGRVTIREYLQHSKVLYHLPNLEEYEKVKNIAQAQGMAIIHSRYDYDEELLNRLPKIYEGMQVEEVNTHTLLQRLAELSEEEATEVKELLSIADEELSEFMCTAIVRRYEPMEIPALHYMDGQLQFSRYAERAKKELPSLWGNILGDIAGKAGRATICFNYKNPLIQQLLQLKDKALLQQYIRLVYLQSLLLGNYQLTFKELGLLTEGLNGLLQLHHNFKSK